MGRQADETIGAEEWAARVGHDRLRDRQRHRAAAQEGRASRRRRLSSSGSAPLVPLDGAWLVGGSVRDLLVGRPVADIDLMVDGDPGAAARGLAPRRGGSPFPLSERHGAWRVVQEGRTVDVTRTRGTVEQDLGLRDFTINAMALPLAGGDLVDPHGGRADLDAGLRAGGQRPDLRRRPAAAAAAWPGSPGSWGS